MTGWRSTVRVWAAFWLGALTCGIVVGPAAAVAASAAKARLARATTATSAAPTATVATSATPVPSSGGSLGGGLTAPGGIPTTTSATPTVITTAPASTSGSSGLSGGNAIAIALGALLVLGGISYFIWRDARHRAPVSARAAEGDRHNRPGSKAPPKARKLSAAERRRRKRGRAKR